jgi:flagellar motor switch/type III secretory pathway protein FliN
MGDGESNVREAMARALGDVPVVVRVEIGAAEMPAREWAALGKGDVIALGAKVADPVLLRVGGVEIARGELVEIDGEVGVRILSRRDSVR